ncbi:LAGLIDADG family homing endonuclease [Turneriella parva]|uniref:DOD-type homing endonuclease domain-containing protein n=1 Tax=Turneriella parva (strain ATCC BAA-1111 / DSM 21527 / NCTC 11395 / H) TaxID=869212 RepID=I4B0C7_TURPD|nr:LAGLIDADG family homing endonuclease [Turneriella parva]AFM10734.1 hypothetical protein Turpa_0071 [Turneriella parva DSM 21527]
MDKSNHNPARPRHGRTYNEEYFAVITTEEQAFWLGMFYGDGFLSPSKKTVGISLAEQDRHHLCKLAITVGDKPASIRTYEPKEGNWQVQRTVRILFGRKRFYETFVALGYGNRKADYADFPSIPDHLLRHFIRGMFDADGYVTHSLSRGKYKSIVRFRFSISVANESFAQRLRDTLQAATGEYIGISRDKTIWAVRATNQKALVALHHYLYEGATVFLERKRKKFDEAILCSANCAAQPAA